MVLKSRVGGVEAGTDRQRDEEERQAVISGSSRLYRQREGEDEEDEDGDESESEEAEEDEEDEAEDDDDDEVVGRGVNQGEI